MPNADTAHAPTMVNPLATTAKTAEQAAADAEVDNFLANFNQDETDEGGEVAEETPAEETETTETPAEDEEVVDDADEGNDSDDGEDDEQPVVEKKKVKPDEAGLARLDAREKELREKEAAFETKVAEAVRAKVPDFTDKEPEDILKHYGHDADIAFKRMLLKRLPDKLADGSVNQTKVKLADELKDANTKSEIQQLRAEMKRKDEAIEQQKFVADFTSKTREQVGKLDSKSNPTLTALTKAKDGGDFVHRLIMKEIIDEAQVNQLKGEQKPLMTFEEATKRVESFIAKVQTMLGTKTVATATKPSMNSPKLKVPLPKTKPTDDLKAIEAAGILAGANEYKRVRKSGKGDN